VLLRHVKKPTYKRHVIFDENFVGIEKRFKVIELNKPIYVGMSVLDLSKVEMYRFHYQRMLPRYGHKKLTMLMTDTDSFIYRVETNDVYADMLDDIDAYDTSDYHPSDALYSAKNKKVLGKMKDELPGDFIRCFVGLRSKMYSIESKAKRIKRGKGIVRRVVEDALEHSDYMAVLFGPCTIDVTQRRITSRHHKIVTVEQNRRGLSGADDKRYVCSDNVHTFAHGHKNAAIDTLLFEMVSAVEQNDDISDRVL
jgi:hypothetical protein